MAILKVARMGHPVLRTRGRPVPPGDIGSPAIQQLIDDLFETMREYSGIGLAAPQVHHSLRIFVAGLRRTDVISPMSDEGEMPFVTLVNPQITFVDETREEGWEGCLSIPDVRGRVPRAKAIRVAALDRAGRPIAIEATGLPARVLQHEYDHLDGVLFFDRMPTLESLAFMEEYQRFWAKDHEE